MFKTAQFEGSEEFVREQLEAQARLDLLEAQQNQEYVKKLPFLVKAATTIMFSSVCAMLAVLGLTGLVLTLKALRWAWFVVF